MSTLTPQDIRRLSVKQYHAMIQAGILSEDDPVELLEGWLVNKIPKNPQHRLATELTREALAELVWAQEKKAIVIDWDERIQALINEGWTVQTAADALGEE